LAKSFLPHRLGLLSAACIVVANMIGTGVFTSLGYQVAQIHSTFALLMLWTVGGVVSLCGALTFAELGSRYPSSGGDYNFLRNLYHPMVGFLSGWVSAVAGFAAPTALAAIAFGKYLHAVNPAIDEQVLAVVLVLIFTGIHSFSVKLGTAFQDFFTVAKVVAIVLFIILVFAVGATQELTILPSTADWSEVFSGAFAVNLIYVSFAYTGWNAAVYIVGEIKDPHMTLPRALLMGTGLVMILYVLIHAAFLAAVPKESLVGKVEIGFIVAAEAFGPAAGNVISIMIALLMISTVSVMVFIGPRVTHKMGEDFPSLSYFGRKSSREVPAVAVLFQGLITLLFIVTSTFEQVLVYSAFSLTVVTMMSVSGIFIARMRKTARPAYMMRFFPVAPMLFLLINAFVLIYVYIDRPLESLIGLGIVLAGIPLYFLARAK
jgi:APA family basic amino acid/polyamine antiporter